MNRTKPHNIINTHRPLIIKSPPIVRTRMSENGRHIYICLAWGQLIFYMDLLHNTDLFLLGHYLLLICCITHMFLLGHYISVMYLLHNTYLLRICYITHICFPQDITYLLGICCTHICFSKELYISVTYLLYNTYVSPRTLHICFVSVAQIIILYVSPKTIIARMSQQVDI